MSGYAESEFNFEGLRRMCQSNPELMASLLKGVKDLESGNSPLPKGLEKLKDFMPNVSDYQQVMRKVLSQLYPGLSVEEAMKRLINPLSGISKPLSEELKRMSESLDDEGIEK